MRRCVGAYVRLSLSQTHAYVRLDVGSETDNCECEFFLLTYEWRCGKEACRGVARRRRQVNLF